MPCHRYKMDIRIRHDDLDPVAFRKRLLNEECLDDVRRRIGLMRSEVHVGYAKKDVHGQLTDFIPSMNSGQWQIALEKVFANGDTYTFTGKFS